MTVGILNCSEGIEKADTHTLYRWLLGLRQKSRRDSLANLVVTVGILFCSEYIDGIGKADSYTFITTSYIAAK